MELFDECSDLCMRNTSTLGCDQNVVPRMKKQIYLLALDKVPYNNNKIIIR